MKLVIIALLIIAMYIGLQLGRYAAGYTVKKIEENKKKRKGNKNGK